VVRINDAVWGRTPYSLVRGYDHNRGTFWVCLHRLSTDILTITLVPTNQITWSHNPEDSLLNLNIMHLLCIVLVKQIKQYQKKWLQHVQRMDTNRIPKQALQYKPKDEGT
jgi:hypothetical protein